VVRRRISWGTISGAAAAAVGLALLFGLHARGHGSLDASAPAPTPADQARSPSQRTGEQFRPATIRFGDSWTVLVYSTQPAPDEERLPAEAWRFTAVGVRPDQIAVQARRIGSRDDAPVTLLLDPGSGSLLRSRVAVPASLGPRIIDRQHDPSKPALVDLSPVPFDRPAFPLLLPEKQKMAARRAPRETVYEGVSAAAAGRVRFGGTTRQRVYRVDTRSASAVIARGLRAAGASWPGKLPASPACRVEILAPGGQRVEQLWAAGIPWPIYSATPTQLSWLVEFKRAT
jgi:hypothetical protein